MPVFSNNDTARIDFFTSFLNLLQKSCETSSETSSLHPLVAYDCMIHDPLFFQINSNYRNILEQADIYFSKKPYTLVLLDTKNCEKKVFLSTLHADIRYVRDFLEVSAIKEENLVVVDHVLYQLLNSSHNTLYVPSIRTEKADALLTCLAVLCPFFKLSFFPMFIRNVLFSFIRLGYQKVALKFLIGK